MASARASDIGEPTVTVSGARLNKLFIDDRVQPVDIESTREPKREQTELGVLN